MPVLLTSGFSQRKHVRHLIKPMISKLKLILGFFLTLSIIYLLQNYSGVMTLITLCVLWFFIFRPLKPVDITIFIIASVFFLAQNYFVLQLGGFSFKHKDILLMPAYEPFLWGFYFSFFKHLISDPHPPLRIERKAIAALALTAACFSLFGTNSQHLLWATSLSTAILLVMFHKPIDMIYSFTALAFGFIIEIFGVKTGLWTYPQPDFCGIPLWFATMWVSVGLLGRNFLFPIAARLSERYTKQKS